MKNKRLGFCSVITKNYLAHARSVAKALLKFHPESPFYVLLADRPDHTFDPGGELFTLVRLEDLPDQTGISQMSFYYSSFEFGCSMKPFLQDYLMTCTDLQSWIFLDTDILIQSNFNSVYPHFETAELLLTRHCESPLPESPAHHFKMEASVLSAGLYNAGFMGIKRGETSKAFIEWWKKRLQFHCLKQHFYEQRWLNFAPLFFKKTAVLADSGLNVAYWNLHERRVTRGPEGNFLVNGKPMIFFHFSGWSFDDPAVLSRHSKENAFEHSEEWKMLSKIFHENLRANGYGQVRNHPYTFDFYENGEKITASDRLMYYQQIMAGKTDAVPPFCRKRFFLKKINFILKFLKKIMKFH